MHSGLWLLQVITTECSPYFSWQTLGAWCSLTGVLLLLVVLQWRGWPQRPAGSRPTIGPCLLAPTPAGMFYSHRKSGQPGPITRIMCCTPEEYDRLPVGWAGVMHVLL